MHLDAVGRLIHQIWHAVSLSQLLNESSERVVARHALVAAARGMFDRQQPLHNIVTHDRLEVRPRSQVPWVFA